MHIAYSFQGAVQSVSNKMQRAFTLLELLLVIAIVASLAGVILSALNPVARLQNTIDTKTIAKSNELEKAIQTYTLDNSGFLPANILALPSYGIYDVCKQGQSTNCVNLDVLVTNGYLSEIPVDIDGATSVLSGYKIEYDPSKTSVIAYSYDKSKEYIENGSSFNKGLKGYWKLDDASGTSAQDSSGNGNTGTLTNGPTWVNGKYSSAISFSGVSDYMNLGDINTLDGLSALSVSMWIKPTNLTNGLRGIITKWDVNNASWFIGNNNSEISVYLTSIPNNYSNYVTTTNAGLQTNIWYNLIVSYNGSTQTVNIYLNGVKLNTSLTGTIPSTLTSVTQSVLIGKQGAANYEFSGQIDDVRIFNRSLSVEEITALYNYAPSPIAHWRFDGDIKDSIATNDLSARFNGIPIYTKDPLGRNNSALNLLQEEFGSTLTWVSNTVVRDSSKNWSVNQWAGYQIATNYVSSYCQAVIVSNTATDLTLDRNCNSWSGNKLFILKKVLYVSKQVNYGTNAITAMGWINRKTNQFYAYHSLMRLTGDDFGIEFGSGSFTAFVDGYANSVTCNLNTLDGEWHHVALTWDGAMMRLYHNGIQCASQARVTTMSNNETINIGARDDGWSHILEGYIDDVRIYNYARTPEQVMLDYNDN